MSRTDHFDEWTGPPGTLRIGDDEVRLPVRYHDDAVFASLHAASYDAVAAQLPSDAIVPVRLADGRAVLSLTAYRYSYVTCRRTDGEQARITPYGEVSIAAMVTLGERPRLVPLLGRALSGFVLHLPVTTAQAREGGVRGWGFPKFVADMDFTEGTDRRRVELSEGGRVILGLDVRPGPGVVPDRRPLVAYTVLEGELVETWIPVRGHVRLHWGRRAGHLALGDHEVADRLRALEVSASPVISLSYLDHRVILPAGRVIGPARPYAGYRGQDVPQGRFTLRYPGTEAMDLYAGAEVRV